MVGRKPRPSGVFREAGRVPGGLEAGCLGCKRRPLGFTLPREARIPRGSRGLRGVAMADEDTKVGGIAVERLRSLIERIERLEEERKALGNDIKDIYGEAKSAGFVSPVSNILCM